MPDAFERIGGDPALDFHNTVSWGREGLAEERLRAFADLVAWGRGAGLVARPEALLAKARKKPKDAERVRRRALDLRGTLHAIFTAMADGREPPRHDLHVLNRTLSETLGRLAIGGRSKRFDWTFRETNDLDSLLGPIAWSAARLLTSDEVVQVGRCGNESCGWLFVDRSRRHNRRWCEMRECGSRAKARRYYARQRAARVRESRPGSLAPPEPTCSSRRWRSWGSLIT